MILTPSQEDTLIEIGNMGVSKAAKQLSVLLQSPIKISIPKVFLLKPDAASTSHHDQNEIFSFVYQTLSDDIQGYVALAFRREQTNLLTMAVLGKIPELSADEARACEQEALLEIGNIIISSCLTVIVDLLAKKVVLSLPYYDENNMLNLLKKLCLSFNPPVEEVLVISTQLDTTNSKMSGSLFLVLNTQSTLAILAGMEGILNG